MQDDVQKLAPTSVSLDKYDVDFIKSVSESFGEPDAVIARQLVRIAVRREWDAKSLRLATKASFGEGSARTIFRLAFGPGQLEAVTRLRGDFPLAVWFRAVIDRARTMDEWGDVGLWCLK